MRILKQIEVSQEVEIDVTAEDIACAIMRQDQDRLGAVMMGLNGCAQWLKAVPDFMIEAMNDAQRETIAGFLQAQADRFGSVRTKGEK
jgi:hypothetical protein